MKAIKFSRNELRVIQACITMTGGNEIDDFVIGSPKLTEQQTYSISESAHKKITLALNNTQTSIK